MVGMLTEFLILTLELISWSVNFDLSALDRNYSDLSLDIRPDIPISKAAASCLYTMLTAVTGF